MSERVRVRDWALDNLRVIEKNVMYCTLLLADDACLP